MGKALRLAGAANGLLIFTKKTIMTLKSHRARRVLLSLALGFGVAGGAWLRPAFAEVPQQVANADALKSKAIEAAWAGKFELTNDYLSQAAAVSKDPMVVRM